MFSWKIKEISPRPETDGQHRLLRSTEEYPKYEEINSLVVQLEFGERLYISSGLNSLDTLDIMVLPKMFEDDGAANYTTNVVDIKGDLKTPRVEGVAELKLPRQMQTSNAK